MTLDNQFIVSPEFKKEDIKIERHRMSTTQGSFLLYFKGRPILTFGDEIKISKSEDGVVQWNGMSDDEIYSIAKQLYYDGLPYEKVAPLRDVDLLDAINGGKAVIMSSKTLDRVCNEFEGNVASMVNPMQVGVLDAFLVGTKNALRAAAPEQMYEREKRSGRNKGCSKFEFTDSLTKNFEQHELITLAINIAKRADVSGIMSCDGLSQETILLESMGYSLVVRNLQDFDNPKGSMTAYIVKHNLNSINDEALFNVLLCHHGKSATTFELIELLESWQMKNTLTNHYSNDPANQMADKDALDWLKNVASNSVALPKQKKEKSLCPF